MLKLIDVSFSLANFYFLFNQNTAYGLRISDWSSDVCSSDLEVCHHGSEFGVECLTALSIDTRTDQVGGHQVGGELHSREAATDDGRVRLDRKGLRHARHTFEQDVTAGQETDQD